MEFETIKGIICEQFSVEEDAVEMETLFVDDLGADSLDIAELVMALEEEYDITIDDEDLENAKSVADVVNYISAKVN